MLTCDDSKTLIVELAELLTHDECEALIQRIENLSPQLAPISTAKGTQIQTNIRNNERVIFDDRELAQKLYNEAKDHCRENLMDDGLSVLTKDLDVTDTNPACVLRRIRMAPLKEMIARKAITRFSYT